MRPTRSRSTKARDRVDAVDPSSHAGRLLSAWRSGGRPSVADVEALRDLLATSVLLHRRGWRAALRAGPAAIVGAGIDLVMSDDLAGPAADVVMSALLVEAVAGRNPAAELVLDHARRRRG